MTHQRMRTPDGVGTVIGLDPFGDKEIGVMLDDGRLVWFSCLVVEPEEATSRD